MNRIYQGRVTKVEIPDGKDENGKQKWKPLDQWQSALWRHHELFQDAIKNIGIITLISAGKFLAACCAPIFVVSCGYLVSSAAR